MLLHRVHFTNSFICYQGERKQSDTFYIVWSHCPQNSSVKDHFLWLDKRHLVFGILQHAYEDSLHEGNRAKMSYKFYATGGLVAGIPRSKIPLPQRSFWKQTSAAVLPVGVVTSVKVVRSADFAFASWKKILHSVTEHWKTARSNVLEWGTLRRNVAQKCSEKKTVDCKR